MLRSVDLPAVAAHWRRALASPSYYALPSVGATPRIREQIRSDGNGQRANWGGWCNSPRFAAQRSSPSGGTSTTAGIGRIRSMCTWKASGHEGRQGYAGTAATTAQITVVRAASTAGPGARPTRRAASTPRGRIPCVWSPRAAPPSGSGSATGQGATPCTAIT
jgi:hypothetical protein